jgi:hypothetical protein
MLLADLTQLFSTLNKAGVRYLIVGGLAVAAHGYSRATHDVDLVLAMENDNLRKALECLTQLGFSPRAPVNMTDFLDTEIRETWIQGKGMQVFSLICPTRPGLSVDIFATLPFDFNAEWSRALRVPFPGEDLQLPFVCLNTLLDMKQKAGRSIDQEDIRQLNSIHEG